MKTLATALFTLLVLNTPAQATELDLVCTIPNPENVTGFDIRRVISGESDCLVALKRSSELNAKIVQATRYAVVMELIPGEGLEPARYEFYTLTDGEFSLSQTSREEYRFTDLTRGITADCEIDRENFINPALTGSN